MLTVNPCSDVNASALCQSIVDHASTVKHDGVLVVERFQRRGRTVIDRPHVHWVLNMPENEAKAIEKKLVDRGLDVKLTLVYDPRGLCWYLAKDPNAFYYIAREDDHIESGTPPSAAMEQQRAGVPVVPDNDKPTLTPLNAVSDKGSDLSGWLFLRCLVSLLFPFMKAAAVPQRLVGLAMTRAP